MSEDFNARYRLLKCVAVDDGIRSHNAQELATGRVVMVHLADAAGPDDVDRLRAMLTRLPSADKNRVLETATLPSGFAIVTEFLAGLTSFPGWLAARVPPDEPPALGEPMVPAPVLAAPVEVAPLDVAPVAAAPAAPAPAAPAPAAPAPGAFTQMFGAPSVPAASPPVAPAPVVAAPPAPSPVHLAPSAPPAPAAPGAFTQMFGAPSLPTAAAPTPDPIHEILPTLPQETPSLDQYPSLNTTLDGMPVYKDQGEPTTPAYVPPAAAAPAPAPPKAGPGDFTLMFAAPSTAAPMPATVPSSPVVPPRPGIVTPPSFMAAPMSSSPAPAAPAPFAPLPPLPPPPGNVSPVFGNSPLFGGSPPAASLPAAPLPLSPQMPSAGLGASPIAASPIAASPLGGAPGLPPGVLPPPMFGQAGATPLSPMGGAAPKPTAGPSDFTRLISQAAAPVVPPAPTPAAARPAAVAAPAKRGIPTGLFATVIVVLMLAVAVIFLVLRKPQPRLPSQPAVPKAPSVSAPKLP